MKNPQKLGSLKHRKVGGLPFAGQTSPKTGDSTKLSTVIKIDPKSTDNQIRERIRSMTDKVMRTGTSQDREEWVTYSNESVYKGFVCIIAKVPKKGFGYRYQGIGKPIDEHDAFSEVKTMYAKSLANAGAQLYGYIDLLRGSNAN